MKKTVNGTWWLPGEDIPRASGILEYTLRGGASLEINESCEEIKFIVDKHGTHYPIIYGMDEKGHTMALEDCYIVQRFRGFSGIMVDKFEVRKVFIPRNFMTQQSEQPRPDRANLN